jgi:hypothetical protein
MRYNPMMTFARLPMLALLLVASTLLVIADATAASRRMPANSGEVWSRWLEFLRDGSGDVAKDRFEEIFGLELSRVQRLSDDVYRHTLRIERSEGRYFLAVVDSYSKENTFALAAIQWTSHFFDDSQCLDLDALAAEVEALGWTPSLPPTPVGASFRKGYAEMAYSRHWASHFQYCGLSLRPHRFGSERLNRVRLQRPM